MGDETPRRARSLRLAAIAVAMVLAAFVLMAAWLASVSAKLVAMGTTTLVGIGLIAAAVVIAAPLVLVLEWSRARKRAGKSAPRRAVSWVLIITNALVAITVAMCAPSGAVTGGLGSLEHALVNPQGDGGVPADASAATARPIQPTAGSTPTPSKTIASATVTPLPTTTATPTADAPGIANVKLVVDGVERTLAHAMVRGGGRLELVLSDQPMRCDGYFRDKSVYGLVVPLFPGPGARYFGGESYRVRAQVRGPFNSSGQGDNLNPAAKLSVVSFKAEPGEHFKGSIDIDGRTGNDGATPKYSNVRATGSIDAVMCDLSPRDLERLRADNAEPPIDLSSTVAGEIAGAPYKSASAIVFVMPPVPPFLGGLAAVAFFETPDVTCESAGKLYPRLVATIHDADPRDPPGSPIVIGWMSGKTEATLASHGAHGWLRVESNQPKPGAFVSGTVHGWHNAGAEKDPLLAINVGGKFVGKVCDMLANLPRDH